MAPCNAGPLCRTSVPDCFDNSPAVAELAFEDADVGGERSVLLVCDQQCRKPLGASRVSDPDRAEVGRAVSELELGNSVWAVPGPGRDDLDYGLAERTREYNRRFSTIILSGGRFVAYTTVLALGRIRAVGT